MTRRDVVTLLGLALIWGSSFLFIRVGVGAMPPITVVELRLALGALAAAVMARALHVPGVGAAFRRPIVAATGMCAAGIPFVLYAYGETRVGSGVAGISNATAPLCAAVIAQAIPVARGGERLTRRRALGLAIGFAGVCVLASDGIRGDLDPLGLFLCFVAPVFYGVGGSLARVAYAGSNPVVAAVAGNGLAALILLGPTLVAGRPTHNPGAGPLLAVAVLGVAGTGLAFVLFYRLMARVGSATFTVTYLMPGVALIEGAIFLGEPLRWSALIALLGILAGVAVASGVLPGSRRDPVAEATAAAA